MPCDINDPELTEHYWSADQSAVTYSDKSLPTATVYNLSNSAENTLTWHVTYKGCSKTDQMVIVNNSVDEAKITSIPASTCDKNVAISANAPAQGEGHWKISPEDLTFVSGNSTTNDITVTGLPDNGIAKFQWIIERKDNAGNVLCKSESSVSNVVNNTISAVINTPTKTVVCEDYIELTANDVKAIYGADGYWTYPEGVTYTAAVESLGISSRKITFKNLKYGDNYFVWHVKGNCPGEETAEITIKSEKFDATVTPEGWTCSDEAELKADLPFSDLTGEWTCTNGVSKENLTYDNSNNYETTVRNLVTGDYSFVWTLKSPTYVKTNGAQGCMKESPVVTIHVSVLRLLPMLPNPLTRHMSSARLNLLTVSAHRNLSVPVSGQYHPLRLKSCQMFRITT